jgi:DNA (cytosine-5)-methyltransferase 1
MKRSRAPTAVDLFSGAGGLTLGLKRSGFRVVAGVEIDPEIAKTYKANHPEVALLTNDIRKVTGEEILRVAGVNEVDLVAGCPPCQGFSKLTDKYRKADPRNGLVLEMARIVRELTPKLVMMENVPGLADRGARLLRRFKSQLEALGYTIAEDILQLADYGVPQSRRRLVLVAGRGFSIALPKRSHARKGNQRKGLKPWKTLRDALASMEKPVTLSVARNNGGPRKFNWHVVRDLDPISIDRYRELSQGEARCALPRRLRPRCHKGTYSGFVNVYGRMNWNQTPPTITAGCTTPCKGRFGHPRELRTISVREAALIQTFPKRYRLETDFMECACALVGNALPPEFAERVATSCLESLRAHGGD